MAMLSEAQMTALIQICMAGLGTFGFSLYFHVRLRNLPAGTIGGIGGWVFYLLIFKMTGSLLLANMIASFLVCIWAEIMARVMKAPVNVFMIPGLIPMIPGGGLYDAMHAAVDGEREIFVEKGIQTGIAMIGIVAGIIGASVVFLYIGEWMAAFAKHKAKRILKKQKKMRKKEAKKAAKAPLEAGTEEPLEKTPAKHR